MELLKWHQIQSLSSLNFAQSDDCIFNLKFQGGRVGNRRCLKSAWPSRDQHLSANGCNFRCNKTTSQKKMKSFFSIRPTRRSMEAKLSVRTWAAVERKRKNPNIRNFHFLRLSVSFWSAFIVKLNHSWNTREINRIGWQVWPRIDALRTDTIQFRCAHTMHLTSSEKWQVKKS